MARLQKSKRARAQGLELASPEGQKTYRFLKKLLS
jgi:hypothetical protein